MEEPEQSRARTAGKAIAADAMHGAAEMDLDIVPIGEMVGDRPVALAIVPLELLERLVGEHHAEPERVVRPVALEHGDAGVRPRFLHQDREIEAGRAAANDVHLHGRLHATAPSGRLDRNVILSLN